MSTYQELKNIAAAADLALLTYRAETTRDNRNLATMRELNSAVTTAYAALNSHPDHESETQRECVSREAARANNPDVAPPRQESSPSEFSGRSFGALAVDGSFAKWEHEYDQEG